MRLHRPIPHIHIYKLIFEHHAHMCARPHLVGNLYAGSPNNRIVYVPQWRASAANEHRSYYEPPSVWTNVITRGVRLLLNQTNCGTVCAGTNKMCGVHIDYKTRNAQRNSTNQCVYFKITIWRIIFAHLC